MQTPKASKNNSTEAPQKISPRAARQLKTTTLETTRASSSNVARAPKDRSPKGIEHKSPKSPASEKKRPSRVSGLESLISQLQEELRNVKDQLTSSESWKRKAEQNAEDLKEQLLAMSSDLKESEKQLSELAASDEAHITNLRKILEERDSALQRAQSVDAEVKILKENMEGTLSLAENMKNQIRDCKESEAKAQALVVDTLLQLETAKKTVEVLQSDCMNAEKAYNFLASELDQSRANVSLLEDLVKKLKADNLDADYKVECEDIENGKLRKIVELEAELSSVKTELGQLRTALEYAEIRYNEEHIQSALLISCANEMVEQIKSASSVRDAELEAELSKGKADIEEMKADLMDKENELQGISEENESLHMKLKKIQREYELGNELEKLREEIDILKGNLMDKETESQNISEENETLKFKMKRREMENNEAKDAKAREREALEKLRCAREEVEKSDKRATRVAEQLEAVQAASAEMEAELRRLKVQSDQWRKAAEAAAAMLSTGNNGKIMERTGSLDCNYNVNGKLSSSYSEDVDDDFLKKKNGNMLKKIGVLWKKPPK